MVPYLVSLWTDRGPLNEPHATVFKGHGNVFSAKNQWRNKVAWIGREWRKRLVWFIFILPSQTQCRGPHFFLSLMPYVKEKWIS